MFEPELNDQQRLIQESARKLAEKHFKPGAARADREHAPPVGNIKVLAEHGFCGMALPEAYGGSDLGVFEMVLVIEQVARACANTAMLLSCTEGATARAILQVGSEAQKSKYLPKFARGESLAAWSMSEANAGSDVGAIETRAVRDGEHYVVNGTKLWCSFASVADLYLVLMRLDPVPGMKGIGALLVERDTPGFTIGKRIDLIGLRATGMSELLFEDCRVPAENLIIPAGGIGKILSVLDADRIGGNPPICLGVAGAAFDAAVRHLKDRSQFGKPLADNQGLQWKLADMAIDIEAGRSLLYRAAQRADMHKNSMADAPMVKTFVNEMAIRVTNQAIQLAGASGLAEDFPFERHFRDVRGMAIGYGTTELLRNTVAREILAGRYLP